MRENIKWILLFILVLPFVAILLIPGIGPVVGLCGYALFAVGAWIIKKLKPLWGSIWKKKGSDTANENLLYATVKRVYDGDTVLLDNGVKVRLYGIDAPESSQVYGKESGQYLRRLIGGKRVCIVRRGLDYYGRLIGSIWLDGVDISAEMLRAGMAWHYTQYNSDANYSNLEHAAKTCRIGLWADNAPVAPWTYRHTCGTNQAAYHR